MFRPWLHRPATLRKLRDFIACRRGTLSVIFYLLLVPMLMTVGSAVDFGRVYNYRTLINSAADAAALAGARDANKYLADNGTSETAQAKAKDIADAAARKFLTAKIASFGLTTTPTIAIDTQIVGRQATVTASVQGSVPTKILGMTGVSQLSFSANSKATMKPGNDQYYQVVFVVDVSNSMGIGGTPSAITALKAHPQIECAFACHDPSQYSKATEPCGKTITTTTPARYEWQTVNGRLRYVYVPASSKTETQPSCDKREIARSASIKLKIDYVNTAINDFMAELIKLNNGSASAGHFNVALYTLGTTSKRLLQSSNNLALAQSIASEIDVEAATTSNTNYGYSYITNGLNYVSGDIMNVGDGSSSSQMKTYVIFISDGVQDVPGNMGWGRSTNISYSSVCSQIQKKNINMFSIWAGYSEINDDSQYNTLVRPYSSLLPTTMKACASSPDLYFTATDGPAIQAAVDKAFDVIVAGSNLRLTQ